MPVPTKASPPWSGCCVRRRRHARRGRPRGRRCRGIRCARRRGSLDDRGGPRGTFCHLRLGALSTMPMASSTPPGTPTHTRAQLIVRCVEREGDAAAQIGDAANHRGRALFGKCLFALIVQQHAVFCRRRRRASLVPPRSTPMTKPLQRRVASSCDEINMNIFAVDSDPTAAARALCDAHGQMTLETAQILCTVVHSRGGEPPYRPTHARHPSVIWAGACRGNYQWLVKHGLALAAELTRRYGAVHKSEQVIVGRREGAPGMGLGGGRSRWRCRKNSVSTPWPPIVSLLPSGEWLRLPPGRRRLGRRGGGLNRCERGSLH